jgi:hypothetical protein
LANFGFASIAREMNSATQENRHTEAWVAPEILEEADTITREADVFAFGMVAIEVGPCSMSHLLLDVDGWMIRLVSERYLRFLQEDIHLVNRQPRSSLQRL